MSGSKQTTNEVISLLSQYVDSEKAPRIREAVEQMAEAIREEAIAESGGSDEETSLQIQRLTEQRDQQLARARGAEQELADLRASLDETVERAKTAVREELHEEIQKAAITVEKTDEELDKVAARINEEAEQRVENFKTSLVQKISRFLEGKLNGAYERLRESMAGDPSKMAESSALHEIAEIVGRVRAEADGTTITDKKVSEANEELVGLRAQVRALEARNSRLNAQIGVLREKGAYEEPSEYSPNAGLADEEGGDEGEKDKYEPEGTIKRESVGRASELLAEAFSGTRRGEPQEDEGWISNVAETRGQRSKRATEVEGLGIQIQEDDIIRETDETQNTGKRQRRMDEAIVPGTSTTRSEFRALAGIPENAK
jgi:hypothetical protein